MRVKTEDLICVKGLKCDTEGCGYVDEDVEYSDYKNYINKACPKCGYSLLTEFDYNVVKAMYDEAEETKDFINEQIDKLYQLGYDDESVAPIVEKLYKSMERVRVELNGQDDIKLVPKADK